MSNPIRNTTGIINQTNLTINLTNACEGLSAELSNLFISSYHDKNREWFSPRGGRATGVLNLYNLSSEQLSDKLTFFKSLYFRLAEEQEQEQEQKRRETTKTTQKTHICKVEECTMILLKDDYYACLESGGRLHLCTAEYCTMKFQERQFSDFICKWTGRFFGCQDFYDWHNVHQMDSDNITHVEYQDLVDPLKVIQQQQEYDKSVNSLLTSDPNIPDYMKKNKTTTSSSSIKRRKRKQHEIISSQRETFPKYKVQVIAATSTAAATPVSSSKLLIPLSSHLREENVWRPLFRDLLKKFFTSTRSLIPSRGNRLDPLVQICYSTWLLISQCPSYAKSKRPHRYPVWYHILVVLSDASHGGCHPFIPDLSSWLRPLDPRSLGELNSLAFPYNQRLFKSTRELFHSWIQEYSLLTTHNDDDDISGMRGSSSYVRSQSTYS